MMLPEGEFSLYGDDDSEAIEPREILSKLRKQISDQKLKIADQIESSITTQTNNKLQMLSEPDTISTEIAQKSLKLLCERSTPKNFKTCEEMFSLMNAAGFLTVESYNYMMLGAERFRSDEKVRDIFDSLMRAGLEPDSDSWDLLLSSRAKTGNAEGAIRQMDNLKKVGLAVNTLARTHAAVLDRTVSDRRFDDALEYWLRMHNEGVPLSRDAFHSMIRHTVKTSQTEKAFFYLDEMQAMGIAPTVDTFKLLFRACAEAPQWVNGYHDIVFDCMSRMEGAELVPNTGIYNNVIVACGHAGDAVAAEFYYWEMLGKGIPPDHMTYAALLNAYAKYRHHAMSCH